MREPILKWVVARHFREQGYKVSMRRIRLGHSEIDGEAIKEGEKIAIEIKT